MLDNLPLEQVNPVPPIVHQWTSNLSIYGTHLQIPTALISELHKTAVVYYMQGHYGDALEWYERALTGKEKALGKDHPSTLNTVHNIALVFCHQGRYGDAL